MGGLTHVPVLATWPRAVLRPAMLIVSTGCAQPAVQGHSSQKYLGRDCVRDIGRTTTGGSARWRAVVHVGDWPSAGPGGRRVSYQDAQGREIRIPHNENTKIDRPAHVGDRIQFWLDRPGRAVLVRSLDGMGGSPRSSFHPLALRQKNRIASISQYRRLQ